MTKLKENIIKTKKFIKKNKIRIVFCLALDLIFIILFLSSLINYSNATRDDAIKLNSILNEQKYNKESTLKSIIQNSDKINLLRINLEKEANKFILIILIGFNLIYGLFFSILFKKLKSLFILKFIGVNLIIQFFLRFVFNLIVNIKASMTQNLILSDKSIISAILFVIFCFLVYFKTSTFIIILRKNSILKSIKKTWKLFNTKFFYLLLNYIMFKIILFILIILIISSLFLTEGIFSIIISISLFLFIFLPSLTLSKIYFFIISDK